MSELFARKSKSTLSTGLKVFLRSSALGLVAALILTGAGCKHGEHESSDGSEASGSSASGGSDAAANFEGVVNMKSDMGGRPAALTLYMKKGKVRTETKVPDLPLGEMVQLWDYSTGKATSLMPAQKTYMTMDFKSMAAEMKKNGTGEYKFPKLTDTGKKEIIAGHTCEHYLVGDEQNVDMCMAKGLGYFGSPSGFGSAGNLGPSFSADMMANASPEWKKLLEGGAFPLKMSMAKNGQTQFSLEVTQIEPKAVDDSLFVIPAGYREMKAPSAP